jgi:hypothetical protein
MTLNPESATYNTLRQIEESLAEHKASRSQQGDPK